MSSDDDKKTIRFIITVVFLISFIAYDNVYNNVKIQFTIIAIYAGLCAILYLPEFLEKGEKDD